MKIISLLLLFFASVGPAFGATEVPPQQSENEASYERNLRDAFNVQILHKALTVNAGMAPQADIAREINRRFFGQITEMELEWRIRPALKKVLSPEFAEKLALQTNKAAYRRREIWGDYAAQKGHSLSLYLDSDEMAQLRVIDASDAMQAWRAMQPKLQAALRAVLVAWQDEYLQALFAAAVNVETLADVPAVDTDGSRLDQLLRAVAMNSVKLRQIDRDLEQGLERAGLNELSHVSGWDGHDKIARSLSILEEAERVTNLSLKELSTMLALYEGEVQQIVQLSDPQFKKRAATEILKGKAKLAVDGELCQRILSKYRKFLTFLQQRAGRFRAGEGTLVFADKNDLIAAHEMMEELLQLKESFRRRYGEGKVLGSHGLETAQLR